MSVENTLLGPLSNSSLPFLDYQTPTYPANFGPPPTYTTATMLRKGASNGAKVTLVAAISFAAFSVWGVHYLQIVEREVCPIQMNDRCPELIYMVGLFRICIKVY